MNWCSISILIYLYVAIQGALALYSYGQLTCLALDCGDGLSQAVPVIDGYPVWDAVQSLEVGGRDLTDYLVRILTERGHYFNTQSERDVVREAKERLCYVELNYDRAMANPTPALDKDYELPDGQNRIKIKNMQQLYRISGTRLDQNLRDIISYSKQLNAFSSTCANDEMSLVKYGSIDLDNNTAILLAITYLFVKYRPESQTRLSQAMTSLVELRKFGEIQYNYGKYEIGFDDQYASLGPLAKECTWHSRNFMANACESCKTFFRRVVRFNRQYECPSNGKCVINTITRTMCKQCRFTKCLAIGMKPELIRSTEENQMRQQLIEENKAKRRENYEKCVDCKDPLPVSEGLTTPSPQSEELNGFLNDLIENTVNISDEEINNQIIDIESSVMSETSSVTEVTAADPQLVIAPVFPVISNYHSWNQLESIRITELLNASKLLDYPLSENVVKVHTFKGMVREYEYRMESIIKDIIGFTKRLNGFKSFCSDDQWTLMKNGCIEMLILRLSLGYNDEGQNFRMHVVSI
ncbi:unnamed protein product [Oppiella nova]|uniref:Nuclear receptor domain-containing protein n=1 Tax=Oppiella nova TaxID=334625 RepID=A0A7R9LC82_9ACAR|nr:unnamed protein product [Oppiella nova]CAG2162126.1 unnamed protein product [Oppiella nova]